MVAQCLVCATEQARVYCEADQAFLCAECDVKIHTSNALAARHTRVPVCELCKASASKVYCSNDKAYLCAACDVAVHEGNPLAARHTIVPVMQALQQEQAMVAGCDCDAHSEAAGNRAQCLVKQEEGETSAFLVCGSDAVVPSLDTMPAPEAQQAASYHGKQEKWGKEFDFLDLDNAWLDRLETGMDFSDILDDAALVPTFDGAISQDDQDHDHDQSFAAVPVMQQSSPKPSNSDNSLGLSLDFMMPSFFGEVPFSGPPAVNSQPAVRQQMQQQAVPVQAPMPVLQQFPASAALNAMQQAPSAYAAIVSSPFYPNPSSFPAVSRDQASKNREACLVRYKVKRTTRKFEKTIRYASRKAYAEIRPRIKGRFARKDEIDEWIKTGIVPDGVVGWNGQPLA